MVRFIAPYMLLEFNRRDALSATGTDFREEQIAYEKEGTTPASSLLACGQIVELADLSLFDFPEDKKQ